jgi:hypothetical protein
MSNTDDSANVHVRLDKWLWAARFFKTRSLAAQAVDGGKVDLLLSRNPDDGFMPRHDLGNGFLVVEITADACQVVCSRTSLSGWRANAVTLWPRSSAALTARAPVPCEAPSTRILNAVPSFRP